MSPARNGTARSDRPRRFAIGYGCGSSEAGSFPREAAHWPRRDSLIQQAFGSDREAVAGAPGWRWR